MCDRCFTRSPGHAEQATHFFFLGCLILLAVAVSGMEARADDSQLISTSTSSASSPAVLLAARTPSSVTVDEKTSDVRGLAQDSLVSLQVGTQTTSQGLDLNISLEQVGGLYETVDDDEQNSTRIAHIASCHQASVGRYYSEELGAFTNALSEPTRFDAAMTHFTAQRDSRIQFDSCSSF